MPLELAADLRPRNPRAGRGLIQTWRGLSKGQAAFISDFLVLLCRPHVPNWPSAFCNSLRPLTPHRLASRRSVVSQVLKRNCSYGELPSCTVTVEFAATAGTTSTTPLGHLTFTLATSAPAMPKWSGWLPCDQNSPPPPPLFWRKAIRLVKSSAV